MMSKWSRRYFSSSAVALTLAGALTGCTVGPRYTLPPRAFVNVPEANGPFASGHDPALSSGDPPAFWWRLYDDPVLDGLVRQALNANIDLRMANANLERSQALLAQAKSLRQPQAEIVSGLQYGQSAGEQYLVRKQLPVGTDYEAELSAGYDLDLFGGIRRGIETATDDKQAVEAARDLVRVNVAAETARAYADVCGAGLQLAAAQKSVALQQESLELTQKLRTAGRAVDLDIVRSRQLLEQLTESVPSLQAAQRNALYRLTALTGRPPELFDRELEECATPPRLRQPLPTGDGAALLKRRPDVRQAERQLAEATASIGVVTAQLYPDVRLGATIGSLGSTDDLLTSPTNLWNYGAQVRWQLNHSATRAKIDAAQAQQKGALAHFDGVVIGALRETETALNIYTHDLQREASAQASRDDAVKAAGEVIRLQKAGRATDILVLDAQRSEAAAEQNLTQLEATLSTDQINVFLALGGGWETEAAGK